MHKSYCGRYKNNKKLTAAEIWEIYGYFPRDSKVRSFCESTKDERCTSIAEYFYALKYFGNAHKKTMHLTKEKKENTELIKQQLNEEARLHNIVIAKQNSANATYKSILIEISKELSEIEKEDKLGHEAIKNLALDNYQRYFFEDWYWKLFKQQ